MFSSSSFERSALTLEIRKEDLNIKLNWTTRCWSEESRGGIGNYFVATSVSNHSNLGNKNAACDRFSLMWQSYLLTCKARPGRLTLKQFQARPKRDLTLAYSLHKNSKEITMQNWTSPLGMTLVSQFSCSVVSDSLRPHGLQHARPPCPSPTPGVYSCPSSQWCHPAISSSVIPFSSRLQSFPASGSFQMSLHIRWPKYWSFNFSISPSNEHSGLISFRMDWWDLLIVHRTLKSLLQHHSSKVSILWQ